MSEIDIPSKKEFLDKLYFLSPIGDADISYNLMCECLGCRLPNEELLTFDLLIQRYKDYLAYIRPYNNIKDKQYIKKDKVQKELGAYLILEMYKNDYAAEVFDTNDNYLFGI